MTLQEIMSKLAAIKSSDVVDFLKEIDKKTWVIIGAGFVTFIFVWVFIIQPGWFGRSSLKKQSVEISSQISYLKTLNIKKPQLEEQKREIEDLIQGFQKKLFTEVEIGLLLGKISKVAQDAQVELVSSTPLANTDVFPAEYEKKYKRTLYQLTVEGSYHRIADFVSLLESYPQYFQIQELDINPKANAEGRLVSDIKLMAVSVNGDSAGLVTKDKAK